MMRTYLVEGAQPAASSETFAGILANLKSSHDFPELDALRMRGTTVQVKHGQEWVDLGAAVINESSPSSPPVSPPTTPDASAGPPSVGPTTEAPVVAPTPSSPPKSVKKSKRFRKLEID